MLETDKVLQVLGIPYSALLSIVFGMMILSFPIGAYVFFNSGMGLDITHEYPLAYLGPGFELLLSPLPFEVGLGDGFVVAWSASVILFAVGVLGPRQDLARTLASILSFGRDSSSNYMFSALKWFAVLVFASALIDAAQGGLGIATEPPDFGDDLTRFFLASLAPFVEEIGFRVALVGLPLCLLFSRPGSAGALAASLWRPFPGLAASPGSRLPALALIAASGVAFGLAHVLLGEPWSGGKLAQATAGGVVLGWVYYRHGLAAAVLLHWATNYFVLSYVYLAAFLSGAPAGEAYSHPMLGTLELLFFVSGAVSAAFLVAHRVRSGRAPGPEAA